MTPGAPGAFKLISGNSQSAQAGQRAGVAAGRGSAIAPPERGLAGQTVNWTVTPAGGAVLGQFDHDYRREWPDLQHGSIPHYRERRRAGDSDAGDAMPPSPFTFTATAIPNISVTGLQIVSGNNQSAIVNTAFGAPLVVQLGASNGSASGIPVQFSITGPGTLSSTRRIRAARDRRR